MYVSSMLTLPCHANYMFTSNANSNHCGLRVGAGLWFSIDNMVGGQLTAGDQSQRYSPTYVHIRILPYYTYVHITYVRTYIL